MQEALLYGLISALSFMGFVSVIYSILLFVYRPNGKSRYIIKIPSNAKPSDIEALIYGAYFKKMVFGDLIFDKIEIDKTELPEEYAQLVDRIFEEIGYCNQGNNKDLFFSEEKDERQS